MADIEKTIEQRSSEHGDFREQFDIAQKLKDVLKDGSKWDKLSPVQKEVLEMLCTKSSRIVTGNPNNPDHWHDIQGYSGLAEKEILGMPHVVSVS